MFLFSKSQSILGIDIGTSYIKAVQIKRGEDKPILESYGMVNVFYPADSGTKFDPVAQTAEVLKALYEKARFTTKRVVLSLPSNVAFVSVLNFPPMSEKEMQKSIEFQAKKYIPLPLTDVSIGWQALEEDQQLKSPTKDDDFTKTKVLLTAVPKNVINNYSKVMESAGFDAQALEIESLSTIRSLVDPGDHSTILIVDLGAKSTILSLVHNGYLWGTRHLTVGGDTITASIAKSMGISFERAEQMKRTSFIEGSASPATQVARTVTELIKNDTQQLIRIAENQGKRVSKIVLTGGGSKLAGLKREFEAIGPVVEDGNPLKRISFAPALASRLEPVAPQFAVAIGLALRSL